MRNRKHARGLSLLLCAVLLAGQLGTTIYAEGTASDTEGLCEHHPEHTAECGYVEAVEGHRCEHVHTDGCYTDQLICGYEEENMKPASDSDAAHEHTQECYELGCPHERGEHEDDCGYKEAVEGRSCGFICDECRKEPETDNGNIPPVPERQETDQEETEDAAVFTITAFDVLNERVQAKTVPVGTKLADLNLPATLEASGYTVDETVEDHITIQDVTWEPDNAWDETIDGGYVFMPVLPAGYTCAEDVELPEISVRIGMVNYAMLSSADDYDTGDKTAFQAILNAHPTLKNISGVDESKPESWKTAGLVAWDNSSPKRITKLFLNSKSLSGTLDVSNLTALTDLKCSNNNALTALIGLEQLENLEYLECNHTQLAVLDVSKNKKLVELYCVNTGLKALDVSKNTDLIILKCALNQLEKLNVSGLSNLDTLDCGDNQLKELDVSGLSNLTTLKCFDNQLKTLDVSGLSNLTALYCYNNPFASFKTKKGTLNVNQTKGGTVKMTAFDFKRSEITLTATPGTGFSFKEWKNPPVGANPNGNTILFDLAGSVDITPVFTGNDPDDSDEDGYHDGDVEVINHIIDDNGLSATRNSPKEWEADGLVTWNDSTVKRITGLFLTGKGLKGKLEVSGLVELTDLSCAVNKLTGELEVGGLANLTKLYCAFNELTGKLDVSNLTKLISLDCSNNQLTGKLDVANLTQLKHLNCYNNELAETLDVSNLTQLEDLRCSGNKLTGKLDVGNLTQLTELNCDGNSLTGELDVSKLTNLTILNCSSNLLSGTLDVSKLTNLTMLNCSGNNLSGELAVPNLTKLSALNCTGNQLSGSLDVSRLKDLTSLRCGRNKLTGTLDVTNLTKLEQLYCSSNQLTVLNVSGLRNLTTLDCNSNPGMETLYCSNTQLGSLDLSGLTNLTDLRCGNIPLTSFTAPDGKKLTMQSVGGGRVIFGTGDPNDTGNKGYDIDTKQVTLTAVPDNGKVFDGWAGLVSGSTNPILFPLSADGMATANFKGYETGGTPADNSGSSAPAPIPTPQPSQQVQPDMPALSVIEIPVTVEDGTAAGTASDSSTSEAITRILNVARQKGRTKYGIAVQYDVTTAEAYDGFSIIISRATLYRLMNPDNKVKYLIINTSIVDLTFDLAALREIAEQSTGDITLTATRVKKLAGDMQTSVGARPAYQLTVSYTGQDGRAATVRDFGRGRVTVGLAYTPAAGEQDGSLYLVYGDDNNRATWYYQSGYDKGSSSVIGSTGHFSVYGVGYKPAPAFTDTVTHWAKADIDFAASRGMLDGTSDTTFSLDTAITRSIFIMALGRLAGTDPAAYASSDRFSDIPADAGYAPYAVWAVSQGIVNGTGTDTFSPDRAITREEMAVIMQRYAEKLGYILPVSREAEIFTDSNKITGSMKDAVRAMQQAGVMGSKGNRLFAPKNTVTRAEAAAILRRFVEIVINPAAAGSR